MTIATEVSGRKKLVTEPLLDRFKVGLACRFSSGSRGIEHDRDADDSPCLSELVQSFLEEDDGGEPRTRSLHSDPDQADLASEDEIQKLLKRCVRAASLDPYRNLLQAHVSKAMEVLPDGKPSGALLRRRTVSFLREMGHNAGVCETRWGFSGGLTAGYYEFIDVMVLSSSGKQTRYLIDLDFPSQFEIARQTDQYSRLLRTLPSVFVGRSDDLSSIVKGISGAAKQSLKSRGLLVPPWRKSLYMRNKWLGPCRRSVNPDPASGAVMCRWVGSGDTEACRLVVRTT